ncbi:MAG: HU family DNA-binding protein [Oscillospiraceae bacterium]|nr:HU family DNA-binding protein [Oscillospiraceae bacterium]
MNKSELIQQAAIRSGLSKRDTELALNAALEVMGEALAQGDKVQLMGFGAFETKDRAPRTARNPKTLEPVELPASRTVSFRPGKALKESVAL